MSKRTLMKMNAKLRNDFWDFWDFWEEVHSHAMSLVKHDADDRTLCMANEMMVAAYTAHAWFRHGIWANGADGYDTCKKNGKAASAGADASGREVAE